MMSGTLTLEKLMEVMASMPKPPFLASSVIFPFGAPIKFVSRGIEHLGAHPLDWAREAAEVRVTDLDTDYQARNLFFSRMHNAYVENERRRNSQ